MQNKMRGAYIYIRRRTRDRRMKYVNRRRVLIQGEARIPRYRDQWGRFSLFWVSLTSFHFTVSIHDTAQARVYTIHALSVESIHATSHNSAVAHVLDISYPSRLSDAHVANTRIPIRWAHVLSHVKCMALGLMLMSFGVIRVHFEPSEEKTHKMFLPEKAKVFLFTFALLCKKKKETLEFT